MHEGAEILDNDIYCMCGLTRINRFEPATEGF